MRRLLGALLATATIAATAACGSAGSATGTTAGDAPEPGTTVPGARSVLVSQTAAGGRPSVAATLLETSAQVAAFSRQFRGPGLRLQVQEAVDKLSKTGHVIVGSVVAVGCDRPPGVDVVYGEDTTIRLLPHEVASPLQECLAPVTTVAVAAVPGSD
ncbi:MAG TPA: hypothetical protein VGK78_16275 [Nocardioides sp.]|uniref:hypothetical protein n=1 Tax=Nocardioides sp. TaxID=35761 RepID=UPI002F4051B5